LLSKNMKIQIYINTIWVVILYGCEAWSLTLREKQAGMLKNRMLRKIFWPKRDEVTGECRRLHNEELYDLYSIPDFIWVIISRRMRGAGHVALWMKRKEHKWFGGEF